MSRFEVPWNVRIAPDGYPMHWRRLSDVEWAALPRWQRILGHLARFAWDWRFRYG